jgi:hypothetical protein
MSNYTLDARRSGPVSQSFVPGTARHRVVRHHSPRPFPPASARIARPHTHNTSSRSILRHHIKPRSGGWSLCSARRTVEPPRRHPYRARCSTPSLQASLSRRPAGETSEQRFDWSLPEGTEALAAGLFADQIICCATSLVATSAAIGGRSAGKRRSRATFGR